MANDLKFRSTWTAGVGVNCLDGTHRRRPTANAVSGTNPLSPALQFPEAPLTPKSGRADKSAPVESTPCVTSYGSYTLQNIGKRCNENQDSYVTTSNSTGTKCFVGVFDGHGEKGLVISSFSRDMVTKALFEHAALHSDPRTALDEAYDETERLIEEGYSREANYSGTTAVAAYLHRDRLYVANIGDSRCVLGCYLDGQVGDSGQLRAVDMSSDHKPSRPDERRRIIAEGGLVRTSAVPAQTPNGTIRLVRVGPERIVDRSGFGGLAVSRAFGDLSLRPFVSSKAEITERKLTRRDRVLILGSDGVWDRVSSQEAVNIAGRLQCPSQAAQAIVSVARKRWQQETQGMASDDITAVVVTFDFTAAGQGSSHTTTPRLPSAASRPPSQGLCGQGLGLGATATGRAIVPMTSLPNAQDRARSSGGAGISLPPPSPMAGSMRSTSYSGMGAASKPASHRLPNASRGSQPGSPLHTEEDGAFGGVPSFVGDDSRRKATGKAVPTQRWPRKASQPPVALPGQYLPSPSRR